MPAASQSWTGIAPSAYDIVACWYPEDDPESPGPKLRPALVLAVFEGKATGAFACRVAYGTSELKIIRRAALDLIVQEPSDVAQLGLGGPTRFDLDVQAGLPWVPQFFGCWGGYATPRIGSLNQRLIREYAFIMIKRLSV